MKYSIHINQKQAVALGITNINQAVIFDLLIGVAAWADPQIIGDEVYYWVARQKIADELPILDIKPKTVYRHLKILADNGLIDYVKLGAKDCVKITEKGKSYYVDSKIPQTGFQNPISGISKSAYKTTNDNTTNDNKHSCEKTVLELFNKILHELPKAIKLDATRKRQIKNLSKEDIPTIEAWEQFFITISKSDFLMGRSSDWKCGFDWIIKPANALKISEGNYANTNKPSEGHALKGAI